MWHILTVLVTLGRYHVCMCTCIYGKSVWCARLASPGRSVASCHVTHILTVLVTLGRYHVHNICVHVYICGKSVWCARLAWLVSSFMSYDIYLLYRHVILQNRRQCTLYCTADIWRQFSAAHITAAVTHTIMCTITYTWRYHSGGYIAGCLALRRIKLCLNCLQTLGKGFLVG